MNKNMVNKVISVVFIVFVLCALTACVQVSSSDKNSFSYSETLSDLQALREPHRFLQKYLKFSQKDLLAMEQGKVVAKVLEKSSIENEVGAFGVVRLNIPKESLVEQFRDIATFTESQAVQEIGKFSNPPRLEDVQDGQEQSRGGHDVVGFPAVYQRRGFPQDERAHDQNHGRVDRQEQRRPTHENIQDRRAQYDQDADHDEAAEEAEVLARGQGIS